jgi:hypothetical protein
VATHTQPLSSTTIGAENMVAGMHTLLSSHGATAVMVEYEKGEAVAMKFKIMVDGEALGYRLPVNWQAVLAVMRRDGLAW